MIDSLPPDGPSPNSNTEIDVAPLGWRYLRCFSAFRQFVVPIIWTSALAYASEKAAKRTYTAPHSYHLTDRILAIAWQLRAFTSNSPAHIHARQWKKSSDSPIKMGGACQLLNRDTCKPLRVHFELFFCSLKGETSETQRERQPGTGVISETKCRILISLKRLQRRRQNERNGDNRNRDINTKHWESEDTLGTLICGMDDSNKRGVSGQTLHSRLVATSSNPPFPHISDGLAVDSLNWVPMATARLAARATLFSDAVWMWQGSQKATSEHRLSVRGFYVSAIEWIDCTSRSLRQLGNQREL